MSSAALIAPLPQEIQKTFLSAKAAPLRVLTVTPFFPSTEDPTQGGFVAEPLAHMSDFGISHEVIAVRPFYRGPARSTDAKAIWKNYFSMPGNVGLPFAGDFLAAQLMSVIRRTHRDTPFNVIHAHAALPCGHAAAVISERLSIPFVVSVHGLDAYFTRQAGRFVRSRCKRVVENVYRRASAVICISEAVREQVNRHIPATTAVIYNGVDPEMFAPPIAPGSQTTILSVGNLIPTKGHASLLRSFARILAEFPECSLEIIGDGPLRADLQKLAVDLGIAGAVHFRGRRSRDYVAKAIRRCRLFALPSEYEGLGCVYLEAMACAKPAIGCRGQGIEEVIEHGKSGLLVSPANDVELSDAIATLLRDAGLRQRIGFNARALILERFTLSRQAKELAEIYRGCAR